MWKKWPFAVCTRGDFVSFQCVPQLLLPWRLLCNVLLRIQVTGQFVKFQLDTILLFSVIAQIPPPDWSSAARETPCSWLTAPVSWNTTKRDSGVTMRNVGNKTRFEDSLQIPKAHVPLFLYEKNMWCVNLTCCGGSSGNTRNWPSIGHVKCGRRKLLVVSCF